MPQPSNPPVGTDSKSQKDNNKPEETPRERFVRLGERRTSNVLICLDRMAALANKNSYEYTDEDVEAIKKSIQDKLDSVIMALRSGKPATTSFKLS